MPRFKDLEPTALCVPYVPFSVGSPFIEIGGHQTKEYITPDSMNKYIKDLAVRIDFDAFDAVLVNMNGGMFFFKVLSEIKNYKKDPVLIEYHRPESGYGAIETIPVPDNLRKSKVLVVDDILDSGGVLEKIFNNVGPESRAVVIITKKGIKGQVNNGRVDIAVKIDNVWVGGCGMNLGFPDEGNTFRDYPGIVIKAN